MQFFGCKDSQIKVLKSYLQLIGNPFGNGSKPLRLDAIPFELAYICSCPNSSLGAISNFELARIASASLKRAGRSRNTACSEVG